MESFTHRRNRFFLSKCREAINSDAVMGRHRRPVEIVREVVERPAPEYFISFDHAYKLLLHDDSRRSSNKMSDLRIQELRRRTQSIMKSSPGLSLSSALARVLSAGNASHLFISVDRGVRLFNRHFTNISLSHYIPRYEH